MPKWRVWTTLMASPPDSNLFDPECCDRTSRMLGRLSARSLRAVMASVVLSVAVGAGCVGPQLQRQFQQDYQCQETPRVSSLGGGRYEVKGCTTTAVYDCSGGPCMADGSEDVLDDEPPAVLVVREEPAPGPAAER